MSQGVVSTLLTFAVQVLTLCQSTDPGLHGTSLPAGFHSGPDNEWMHLHIVVEYRIFLASMRFLSAVFLSTLFVLTRAITSK